MGMLVTKMVLGFVVFIGFASVSANSNHSRLSFITSKLCQANSNTENPICAERSDAWFVVEKGEIYKYSKSGSKDLFFHSGKVKSVHILRGKNIVALTHTGSLYISARDKDTDEADKHMVQIASKISKVSVDRDHLIAVYDGVWRFSTPQIIWFYYPDSRMTYGRKGMSGVPDGLYSNYVLGQGLAGVKSPSPFYDTEITNFEKIYKKDGEIWLQFQGDVHLPWSSVIENLDQFSDSVDARRFSYFMKVYESDRKAALAVAKTKAQLVAFWNAL